MTKPFRNGAHLAVDSHYYFYLKINMILIAYYREDLYQILNKCLLVQFFCLKINQTCASLVDKVIVLRGLN
jgi:hypothetical protein